MVTQTGWDWEYVGQLYCPVALGLLDYWAACPPTHLMLKFIGEALGVQLKIKQVKLNKLESQVQDGYVPGMGQIPTTSYDSLPITVREMLVELKRKGSFNA